MIYHTSVLVPFDVLKIVKARLKKRKVLALTVLYYILIDIIILRE